MPSSPPVITRFAPSPTGHLHIGGARSALFCWAFAKKHGGHFVLRIEDTDQARSSDESARGIMEDLAWLGIEWDEGPELSLDGRTIGGDPRGTVGTFFQARRVPIYHAYIESLVKAGRAYPAFESAADLEAKRKAAVAAKQTYRYERPADVQPGVFNAARCERAQKGESHVIRFLALHEEIIVPDQVLGDVRIAAGELDDFVILKADRFPTYHFAVVIDDETMGVTHVMRAQEHLANTPRHVAMQKALRRLDNGAPFRTPVYAHMPLIFNMDGTKMSKRDKAKAARKAAKDAMAKDKSITAAALAQSTGIAPNLIAEFIAAENDNIDTAAAVARHFKITLPEIEVCDFREAGYLPAAICNFLSLLGWNPGMKTPDGKDLEKFDMKFLAEHFSIERIGKTNAKFDRAKLLSFNADAINALPDQAFADTWRAWCEEYEPAFAAKLTGGAGFQPAPPSRWLLLARTVKPRAKTLRDGVKACAFLLRDDHSTDFDKAAADKNLLANERAGLKLLTDLRVVLAALLTFDPEPIHAAIEKFASDRALGMGAVAQPLRVAIAGVPVTPPLGETLAILGRDAVLKRIDLCLSTLSG